MKHPLHRPNLASAVDGMAVPAVRLRLLRDGASLDLEQADLNAAMSPLRTTLPIFHLLTIPGNRVAPPGGSSSLLRTVKALLISGSPSPVGKAPPIAREATRACSH